MLAADFLASLPAPLSLRGSGAASYSDVVARVRNEVKACVKACLPAGTKVSVRSLYYGSLCVEITAWHGAVFTSDAQSAIMDGRDYHGGRHNDHLTAELAAALRLLEQVASRHNYDNSQIEVDYFEVGYYLHVDALSVVKAAAAGIREEMDPELAALRARAEVAAAKLGAACVRSVLGRGGLATAGKSSLERLLKIADRAQGREVTYDRQRRAWLPVAA